MTRAIDALALALNPWKRRNLDAQARRLCVVSHARRCVYVMNYRCGSTTLRRALIELELTGRVGDPAFLPPSRDVRAIFPEASGLAEVRRLTRGEGYFLFSMVRDPLSRLVSAYEGKLAVNRKQERPIKAWLADHGRDVGEVVTFDQFVDYLENAGRRGINNHWRPQHEVLMRAHLDFDLLGRVETFADSFREIFDRLGATILSVPHYNAARADTVGGETLTLEMRRRVHALFRKDYELFGYPPPA